MGLEVLCPLNNYLNLHVCKAWAIHIKFKYNARRSGEVYLSAFLVITLAYLHRVFNSKPRGILSKSNIFITLLETLIKNKPTLKYANLTALYSIDANVLNEWRTAVYILMPVVSNWLWPLIFILHSSIRFGSVSAIKLPHYHQNVQGLFFFAHSISRTRFIVLYICWIQLPHSQSWNALWSWRAFVVWGKMKSAWKDVTFSVWPAMIDVLFLRYYQLIFHDIADMKWDV